ncbi:hypothetical protein T05_1045 [Trichinella murrelli]|uniref:Uncharacterized protein n=1 Tax=Trichinella murrelli TaxID=144512 RepID=A0A0V0UA54_9BILA|nr:hypothetical protein T05_1045 [Trichinella murrelli]
MTETNGLESKEAHDTDISKFGKVSFTIVEACTAIWTMEEEKARCIASISISVGVAAGATDGCCRNQEQQRISKKQKKRKSSDLLAVHTLLQKALANEKSSFERCLDV